MQESLRGGMGAAPPAAAKTGAGPNHAAAGQYKTGAGSYHVKLEAFEGPFDLLFHLIEKNKIDIYDIPISSLADQYMDYILSMQEMDLEVTGSFLVMASTLLHIKSRLMLPAPAAEGDGEGDPREDLVISIIEYKKYKDFTETLRGESRHWALAFYRPAKLWDASAELGAAWRAAADAAAAALEVADIDPDRLAQTYRALAEANRKKMAQDVGERVGKIVERDKAPVSNKIREIVRWLARKRGFLFQKAFPWRSGGSQDIISAFMAVLELSRQNRLRIRQKKLFGGIFVSRMENNG